METSRFKTIIIGAGPAGLTAGKYLEDALIIDQKEEIGRPVHCAEGISRNNLEFHGIKADPSWTTPVNKCHLICPNGRPLTIECEEMGYILDRVAFEQFLASMSKAQIKLRTKAISIELKDGLYNVATDTGEVFESEYLIGADGPLSLVRTKIFGHKVEILPTIAYSVELEKEIDTSTMRMYFDNQKYPNGYVWIFPKTKHRANIGLGGKMDLDQRYNEFMERVVRREFGNYKILDNMSGMIPWGGALLPLRKGNILLTGDAGALIDPIFGGGIHNAMVSGKMAAECILNKDLDSYESKIKSTPFFRKELIDAQRILYSLPNEVFDELEEVFRGQNLACFTLGLGTLKFLTKPRLRKNAFKLFKLFNILKKGVSLG